MKNSEHFTQYTDPNTAEEIFVPCSSPKRKRNRKKRRQERSAERDWNSACSSPPRIRNRQNERQERSTERDWNSASPRRFTESYTEDERMNIRDEEMMYQQQQRPIHSASTSSYPLLPSSNGYDPDDYYPLDPSISGSMMSQYKVKNTMNQWGLPVNSGMPDLASTSTCVQYPNFNSTMYGTMSPMQIMNGDAPFPVMMNRDATMPLMDRDDTMPGEDADALRSRQERDVMTFASCVLIAPRQGTLVPPRRLKPKGCKTVFVGELPELINEDILNEVFSDFGEIYQVKLTRSCNFCHIRFAREEAVDKAVALSGYIIQIENKDERGYRSRLLVDYAKSRDDQYEYECRIRDESKEVRHAEVSLSPKVVANYSKSEAATVREDLKDEKRFVHAMSIVNNWLERGECNKTNAGMFYSLIQSVYSHVRRLVGEKTVIEEEMAAVKERLTKVSTSNAAHFKEIERVFTYASARKVWDHFSKPQRKHISEWQKHTIETKTQNLDDLLEERVEDEMEMSDAEDQDQSLENAQKTELSRLQEEVVLLRKQLQTAVEETVSVRVESKEKYTALENIYKLMNDNYCETKKKLEEAVKASPGNSGSFSVATPLPPECNEEEARLVALIATFLNVHPKGASIQYICSYLAEMDSDISRKKDVEKVLNKYSTIFKEESVGVGATLAKKWKFWGYEFNT